EPLSQSLPIEDSNQIKGDIISVGAWIWADFPQKTRTPMIRQGYQEWFNLVEVTKVPTFYSFKVKIPDEEKRIWIAIDPYLNEPTRGDIYYDGIVVTSAPIENLE
ncbi:MAG: hypothetical protein GWN00_12260, partial [Aliifodinibius sp.]|nr:hypothetical protein [Fodinibius sp.]NIV11903.1 hypothetical protein [Fodinibius sp.]NIY25552.1 hypothetical protein [Fodinibius sp.]